VVGELARRLTAPADQLLLSRSAGDLVALAKRHPALTKDLTARRALLAFARTSDRAAVETALDAERRALMAADVERLDRYRTAAEGWAAAWPDLHHELASLPLARQHERMVERALSLLPFAPPGDV